MMILRASNLRKSYPEGKQRLQVLEKIDLEIYKGDFIAITGQSGCGKSTLLHVLGLLDSPDSGELLYENGQFRPNPKKNAEFRLKHVGFIFQFHYLLEDLTARENLAVPLLLQGIPYRQSMEQADSLLHLLDMKDRGDHYPHMLSGGESQRIAIGRAVIHKPDIIFADEPTGNLDPKHSSDVVHLFSEMQRTLQLTVVMVTHDASIAAKAQQQWILEDGILRKQSSH